MQAPIRKLCIAIILFMTTSSVSYATNLLDVYQQALKNDPIFQAAYAQQQSSNEIYPQSLAGLLPNLSANANTTGNYNEFSINKSPYFTTKFNSNGYGLNLTQPLINFTAFMKLRGASATVKQSNATYAAAAQDLILRTANAYFTVLKAEDNLRYISAEKSATARQLDQAKQRFDVGLETITTVNNAQASYDSTVAQEIAAQNTVINSREELLQITGRHYSNLAELKKNFPLQSPNPNNIDAWSTSATQRNLTLLATQFALDAARENIKVNFTGHLPSLNFVGTYANANNALSSGNSSGSPSASIGAVNSKLQTATIGLQLSVPIFEGGLVTSQTRQAQYDFQKAAANLESTYRNVLVKSRETYNNVIAGISQIKADKQAMISNQSSLESTEESFKVGTRTMVDVLIAQQNLLEAQRNYSQNIYAYLINTLTLKQLAGNLSISDIAAMNTLLVNDQKTDEG